MESSSQDRNLPATERKLQQARRDGQVSRSRDLGHLAVVGSGVAVVWFAASVLGDSAKTGLARHLTFSAQGLGTPALMLDRLGELAIQALAVCALVGVVTSVAAIAASWAVGGRVMSLKPLEPDFSRISPFGGVQRLFSKEHFAEILKLSVLAAALLGIGLLRLEDLLGHATQVLSQPMLAALRDMLLWLMGGVGLLLLPLLAAALVDAPLQMYFGKARLRMSHQEVKQEHKESDGNPQVKGRVRSRQREIANRNSVKAVPKADLVLMNPTHYAVALRYDDTSMSAPRVVSKGADRLAMHIRDLAMAHKVPVLQSPVLARALYAHAELDREIPGALYTAVAQVLAYVYRLRAALRGEGPMPAEVPQPFVDPELDPHHTSSRRTPS